MSATDRTRWPVQVIYSGFAPFLSAQTMERPTSTDLALGQVTADHQGAYGTLL